MVSAALMVWALAIAVFDGWQLRVPNVLLVLVAVPALLIQVIDGHGMLGVASIQSAAGLLIGFALVMVGHVVGQVGAGDVKYAAVVGFLCGVTGVLKVLLLTALVLGAMSLAALVETRLRQRTPRKIPAAIAISAGFIAYLSGV